MFVSCCHVVLELVVNWGKVGCPSLCKLSFNALMYSLQRITCKHELKFTANLKSCLAFILTVLGPNSIKKPSSVLLSPSYDDLLCNWKTKAIFGANFWNTQIPKANTQICRKVKSRKKIFWLSYFPSSISRVTNSIPSLFCFACFCMNVNEKCVMSVRMHVLFNLRTHLNQFVEDRSQ